MNLINKGLVPFHESTYERFAIRTHFIERGESYLDIVNRYISAEYKEGDVLFISEKIISICQNRVIEKSELTPSLWAKILSKFVMKTTAGYSVGNVYKMQLAIKLAGLPRILLAAFCSALTKPFGIKGVFYIVAGNEINGIDGFYGEAFSEYESLGILNPENPQGVCEEIFKEHGIICSIVDANDIGCNVLGSSSGFSFEEKDVRHLLKDNPAGQGNECTPFILLRKI